MSDAPMQDLEQEISRLIIETLNMEDVSPADINPAEPLFDSAVAGGGLVPTRTLNSASAPCRKMTKVASRVPRSELVRISRKM